MVWQGIHIITQLELGGAQLATLNEIENVPSDIESRHLFFGPDGMLEDAAYQLNKVDAQVIPSLGRPVDPLKDLAALGELIRTIRKIKRNNGSSKVLVHTHSSKAGILGRWAAHLAGADLIVHSVHGFGHSHISSRPLRSVLTLAERATAHITDGFTADSAANLVQGDRESIFAGRPTRVIHCGINVDYFAKSKKTKTQMRSKLAIPRDHTVALNLSCLKPQKDPETYVRVLAKVLEKNDKVTFLLAGDGVMRSKVERLAEKLGVGQHLRLLGWRRDVPELLRASDMLVLTSRWEGLPQVFAQAMAASLPIVATRVDGAPEAIECDKNGLLCDPGDVECLAQSILELSLDKERRKKMGRAGKRQVAKFSEARMVNDLADYYEELGGPRRIP